MVNCFLFKNPVQYQNANPQSQPQQGPPQYFVQPINQNSNQIRSPPQQAQVYILLNKKTLYNH